MALLVRDTDHNSLLFCQIMFSGLTQYFVKVETVGNLS